MTVTLCNVKSIFQNIESFNSLSNKLITEYSNPITIFLSIEISQTF